MDLIAISYESAGFPYSNLRLMSNLRAEVCSRSNVHLHIGAQHMSLGLQKHCRGRDVLGLPLHRKKTSRRKEYQVVGMGNLRASVSENVISRSRRGQSNKDELTSLEALASNATLITKRGPAFKGRKDHPVIVDLLVEYIHKRVPLLKGSVLCFIKGCFLVMESFSEYFHAFWQGLDYGEIVLLLMEAIDVYLMGTVMLIFGFGLYELFISNLLVPSYEPCRQGLQSKSICGSNLFGLFHLRERPPWLEIHSLEELKSKIGHVIVMILLVGLFEKSKRVPITTGLDMVCFSASILLSSACIFLLSKLSVK
eukprot:Gb_22085 [translate_table: standard]